MDFMTAVKTCFRKYVDWNGRALRSEYWWWILFSIIVTVVTGIVDVAMNIVAFNPIWSLASFLPTMFVATRRLHDLGKSGWWQLIAIVPVVGWILLIVWYAKEGEPQANDYGPAPSA